MMAPLLPPGAPLRKPLFPLTGALPLSIAVGYSREASEGGVSRLRVEDRLRNGEEE